MARPSPKTPRPSKTSFASDASKGRNEAGFLLFFWEVSIQALFQGKKWQVKKSPSYLHLKPFRPIIAAIMIGRLHESEQYRGQGPMNNHLVFASPVRLTRELFHPTDTSDPLLPVEMEHRYARTDFVRQLHTHSQRMIAGVNTALWQPSQLLLRASNHLEDDFFSGQERALQLSLHDELPVPKRAMGRWVDKTTEKIRQKWGKSVYVKTTLEMLALAPIIIGYPSKWSHVPFHIPSISLTLPIVGKVGNPPDELPFINVSANAFSALGVFGIPNIYRSLNEHRYGRAALYTALHIADLFVPAVITNSFFWDLFARSHDSARIQGRLRILQRNLHEKSLPKGKRQRYEKMVESSLESYAKRFGLTKEEYVKSIAAQEAVISQEIEGFIGVYTQKIQDLEEVIAQKQTYGILRRGWVSLRDEAFIRNDIEQARREAIQAARRLQMLPLVTDVIASAGKDA